MPRNLGNAEDIQKTNDSMESYSGRSFLSIPDSKTPWYLISLDYVQYYSHWYDAGEGRRSIICAGGPGSRGWSPDNCPICAYVQQLYQEGKRLRDEGKIAAADRVKDQANSLRGRFQVVFKVIRGQYALVKDPKTGKKRREADFDMDSEDSSVEVGLLSMSQSQWDSFYGLTSDTDYPFITHPTHLGKHVLFTKKERRKGRNSKYTQVVWGAEEEESDLPDVEIPSELLDLDLDELGKINIEEVEKVAEFLSGQQSEQPAEDEDVELEDDDLEEDSEDEPDDGYLDDVEGDDSDEDEEDDFEDDIPEGFEDDAPPKKRSVSRSTKPSKRSGKTRM